MAEHNPCKTRHSGIPKYKRRFEDASSAWQYLWENRRDKIERRPYICPRCHNWHIGQNTSRPLPKHYYVRKRQAYDEVLVGKLIAALKETINGRA